MKYMDYLNQYVVKKSGGGGGGITPTGTIKITKNGTYDVAKKAEAVVAVPPSDDWVRPSDWPDLDSIMAAIQAEPERECVYMVYDLAKAPNPFISVGGMCYGGDMNFTLERGHIENGQFVAEYTQKFNRTTVWHEQLSSAYGRIQLWRLSGELITYCGFCAHDGISNDFQPCVEVIKSLYRANALINNISTNIASAYSVQYTQYTEHVVYANLTTALTSMDFLPYSYSLQRMDFVNCNLTGLDIWNVIYGSHIKALKLPILGQNLSRFSGIRCTALKKYDLSDSVLVECRTFDPIGNIDCSVVDYYPPIVYCDHSYANDRLLSGTSIERILNSLPEITTSKTCTLGAYNQSKVTPELIAIAVEKGWTIA